MPTRAASGAAASAASDPLEQLRQLCADDPGAFSRLVRDHIINAQTLIGRIHSALNAGNLEAAAIAAHSLRGTAGSFGSARVAEMAGQIEQLAQQGRAREALQAFGQLMSAWFSSEARLGKVIREAGGNPTQTR
jgi:HPt (histidine-containing phosphotransfer) domain-containing protein